MLVLWAGSAFQSLWQHTQAGENPAPDGKRLLHKKCKTAACATGLGSCPLSPASRSPTPLNPLAVTPGVYYLDGQTPSWRVRSPSTTRMGDQMDVQADTGVRASLVPRHTPEGKNQELDQGGKRPQNRGLRGGTSCKRTHALSISNPTSCSSNPGLSSQKWG